MQQFYEDTGFIIGFLILVFLMETFISEKASEGFVGLTLLSMVLFNNDKFKDFLSTHFTAKED